MHIINVFTLLGALGTVLADSSNNNSTSRSSKNDGGTTKIKVMLVQHLKVGKSQNQLVKNCTTLPCATLPPRTNFTTTSIIPEKFNLQASSSHSREKTTTTSTTTAIRSIPVFSHNLGNSSNCHNCSTLFAQWRLPLLLPTTSGPAGGQKEENGSRNPVLEDGSNSSVSVGTVNSFHMGLPTPLILEKSMRVTRQSKVSNSRKRQQQKQRKKITILGLFELTHGHQERPSGPSELYAAKLALNHINEQNIVQGYELIMTTNDTKCDSGVGMDAFYHAIYLQKEVRMIALLGTACSEVTERLAKIVPYKNMVQVSFGSTSPSLSDRAEFPLFYRTVAPVCTHDAAIIALFHHFNWDEVTFFTKNENRYTMPVNHLVPELENANITCKATVTFSLPDIKTQLGAVKGLDSRIIVASFGLDIAAKIFCEIHAQEMYGKDYAWILIGQLEWSKEGEELMGGRFLYNSKQGLREAQGGDLESQKMSIAELLLNATSSADCKTSELKKVLERTIIIDRYNFMGKEDNTASGMTAGEFRRKMERRNHYSRYAPEAYDAMWTIAVGLESVRSKYNYTLDQVSYEDDSFALRLWEAIKEIEFDGMSGPISFSGPDRIGITSIMQIQGESRELVGLFSPRNLSLNLECSHCREIKWPNNQVPIARREFRTRIIRVESSPYIIVTAVASLGIVMAAAFLAFNLYHRKLKYIKLSSPRLNNMVIIGCIFAYVAVILLGCDFGPEPDGKHFAYICTARAYLLSTGFSLAFGAMFAKTYRVHRIFTRCHGCLGVVKNKLLRDTQLMTLVMALLFIDCLIVTSWAVFDPMHRNLQNLTIEDDPDDRSVVYQQQIEVCSSQHGHVWLSILYGYKSLLLVVGVYMAWETRHVKIQALNDSNYIGLSVYVVVLTSVLGVSVANLVSDKVTLSFISVTSLILISTTVTLCLLFLPKIHAIMYSTATAVDPVVESMGLKIEFNTRRFMVEDTKESLFRAEVQNRVYKRQIESVDVQIKRLERLLAAGNSDSKNPLVSSSEHEAPAIEPLKKGTTPVVHVTMDPCSSLSSDDTESQSEIYTIYLHGPRFIIPVSLFNFNTNTEITSVAAAASEARAVATAIGISTNARSSWPNTRSQLTPVNGLISAKYYFNSEPKLLSEDSSSLSRSSHGGGGGGSTVKQQSNSADNVDQSAGDPQGRKTFNNNGGSDNTINIYKRHSASGPFYNKCSGPDSSNNANGDIFSQDSPSDRKNSSTSCGSRQNSSSHSTKQTASFLLSVFRHPLSYLTGIMSSSHSNEDDRQNSSEKLDNIITAETSPDSVETRFLHTSNHKKQQQKIEDCKYLLLGETSGETIKFSSVPDLWAVRNNSPVMGDKRKKGSINSDSVIDANTISLADRHKANSVDPVLTLRATSDESPYL